MRRQFVTWLSPVALALSREEDERKWAFLERGGKERRPASLSLFLSRLVR